MSAAPKTVDVVDPAARALLEAYYERGAIIEEACGFSTAKANREAWRQMVERYGMAAMQAARDARDGP